MTEKPDLGEGQPPVYTASPGYTGPYVTQQPPAYGDLGVQGYGNPGTAYGNPPVGYGNPPAGYTNWGAQQTVYTQQVPVTVQPITVQEKDWSSGLLECYKDPGICMQGWCCPWCYAGDIAAGIGAPPPDICFFKAQVSQLRGQVRQKYGITKSTDDFCAVYWCAACAICQMGRELKHHGVPI